MVIFIGKDIFVIASNNLISNYDFIPKGISKEQIEICEDCRYRWLQIDLDIAKNEISKKFLPFTHSIPACDRKSCLIDNQNLLKQIKLIELKRRRDR